MNQLCHYKYDLMLRREVRAYDALVHEAYSKMLQSLTAVQEEADEDDDAAVFGPEVQCFLNA
eukprot:gene28661-35556_t